MNLFYGHKAMWKSSQKIRKHEVDCWVQPQALLLCRLSNIRHMCFLLTGSISQKYFQLITWAPTVYIIETGENTGQPPRWTIAESYFCIFNKWHLSYSYPPDFFLSLWYMWVWVCVLNTDEEKPSLQLTCNSSLVEWEFTIQNITSYTL